MGEKGRLVSDTAGQIEADADGRVWKLETSLRHEQRHLWPEGRFPSHRPLIAPSLQ